MANELWNPGSIATVLGAELNSLGNNAAAVSSTAYKNTTNKLIYAWLELTVTFGSNPTAGSQIGIYLVPALDGTNFGTYTSGASGYGPPTQLLGSFVLEAKTTLQRLYLGAGMAGPIILPPYPLKFLSINWSGVAFPASGSTVKIGPAGRAIS